MDYERILKIENYELKLYHLLEIELAAGAKRLDYKDLSDRIGCSRSTISRNVGKLFSAGLIGFDHGKIYLK